MISQRFSEPNRDHLKKLGWVKMCDPTPIRIRWNADGTMQRIDDPGPEWETAPHEIELWMKNGNVDEVMCLLVPRVVMPTTQPSSSCAEESPHY